MTTFICKVMTPQGQVVKIKLKEKDEVINSVTPLRKELTENVNEIKKHKKEYQKLIQELKLCSKTTQKFFILKH